MNPAETFDRLREDYYRVWFRFHPETALDLGVADHAHRLRPASDEDIAALITLDEKLLVSLEELERDDLDPDRQIDVELMAGAASLEIEELVERDWRKCDPEQFLPVNAIHQLFLREVPDFAGALLARLRAIPAYLREARQELAESPERVPPIWLESAIEGARRGVEFLRGIPRHSRVLAEARRLRELPAVLAHACEALSGFADFLEDFVARHAAGEFACGARRYERLLNERHFLEVGPERLLAFGRDLVARTEEGLRALEAPPPEDRDALKGKDLLAEYRRQMAAARDFTRTARLVTWPESEQVSVVETPAFLRHQIPFAAYVEPTPRDPRQQGWYYVTLREDVAVPRHEVMHTCVHEAYPGHHLQFVTAHRHAPASTWPRLAHPSATLYEGWALYCEQLMHEQGFLSGAVHERTLLHDRLWRALRVVIDVGIHARGMTLAEAERLMSEKLGFSAAQIKGELTWYSRAPSVPMAYATGWALIVAARECLRASDPAFALRSFHDRLLSCGSLALPLALRRAFGPGLAAKALAAVFGGETDALISGNTV